MTHHSPNLRNLDALRGILATDAAFARDVGKVFAYGWAGPQPVQGAGMFFFVSA